jgi:hypothetical protein
MGPSSRGNCQFLTGGWRDRATVGPTVQVGEMQNQVDAPHRGDDPQTRPVRAGWLVGAAQDSQPGRGQETDAGEVGSCGGHISLPVRLDESPVRAAHPRASPQPAAAPVYRPGPRTTDLRPPD